MLRRGWDKTKSESRLGWEKAKLATRDAWNRLDNPQRDSSRSTGTAGVPKAYPGHSDDE